MKIVYSIGIPALGVALLLSCTREPGITDLPTFPAGGNETVIGFIPESGNTKTTTERISGAEAGETIADLSRLTGIDGLLLKESISELPVMGEHYGTKGIPATTANFADLHKDGFRAFAVYAGSTDRSKDLAATFVKQPDGSNWTHFYEDETWPDDNNLLYYFHAPNTLPSYINIVNAADASQEHKSIVLNITNGYPATATGQKDIIFAAKDITVVRGGISEDNPVKFFHIFTAVKFKQGNTDSAFTINNIALTGMPVSGTCTVTLDGGITSSEASVWTHPETSPETAGFTMAVSESEAFFCIPRTFNKSENVKLAITYTRNGGTEKTDEINLAEILDGKSWLAGQMYTYTLTVSELGISVTDTVQGNVKKDPVISNTGNVSEYIRATIEAKWVRKNAYNEIVVFKECNPAEEGTFVNLAKQNWVKKDGFFYYTHPVKKGRHTLEPLFETYTAGQPPVDGSFLQLTISAQAVPYDKKKSAAGSAWGYAAASVLDTAEE